MYQNASSSSLVGGVPYAYYMSKSGSKISAWHNLDYQNLIFPEQSTTTGSVGSQDNTNFVNFEDDIEGFFPTISSATAQARYEDKTLTGMKITVNTSFYSVSEIKAFSTYISEVGPKYFTKDIPIDLQCGRSSIQSIQKESSKEERMIKMAKGLVAGILATAAAYVAFKALPQEKQDELIKKAKDAGNKLKDLGYDAAYAGADLAGDLSEKAKNKVGEFDEQIKDSKYADTYQGVKDKAADVIDRSLLIKALSFFIIVLDKLLVIIGKLFLYRFFEQ